MGVKSFSPVPRKGANLLLAAVSSMCARGPSSGQRRPCTVSCSRCVGLQRNEFLPGCGGPLIRPVGESGVSFSHVMLELEACKVEVYCTVLRPGATKLLTPADLRVYAGTMGVGGIASAILQTFAARSKSHFEALVPKVSCPWAKKQKG